MRTCASPASSVGDRFSGRAALLPVLGAGVTRSAIWGYQNTVDGGRHCLLGFSSLDSHSWPGPNSHPSPKPILSKDRLLQPTRASHWWLSPFCSAPREPSRTQALAVQEGAGGLSSASSLFWVYQERAGVTGKKKPLAIDCSSSLAAPCSRSEKAHLDADVEQERPSRPEQTRPALLITQSSATAGSGPGNSH